MQLYTALCVLIALLPVIRTYPAPRRRAAGDDPDQSLQDGRKGEGLQVQEILPYDWNFGQQHHPGSSFVGSWPSDANGYPDPQANPTVCGRPRASYVCDPDRILTEQQADDLDRLILDIVKGSKCVCGSGCTATRGRYSIAIALAGELFASRGPGQSPTDKVTQFTTNLRMVNWNYFGYCQDNMVIGVVDKDRQLFTATSALVRGRLPNSCVNKIFTKVQPKFTAGNYYDGLKELLSYYRNALHGGDCGTTSGLSIGQIVGIVVGVVSGVAMIVATVLLCVGFCQNWECVVGTCIGMVIGSILGAFQACINAVIIAAFHALLEAMGCDDCACDCEPLDCIGEEDDGFRTSDGGGGGGGQF